MTKYEKAVEALPEKDFLRLTKEEISEGMTKLERLGLEKAYSVVVIAYRD
jgi:hypothetical protein